MPYDNRERAVAGLRAQLRHMALTEGWTPEWSSLVLEGPTRTRSLHGAVWFEWTASVEAS